MESGDLCRLVRHAARRTLYCGLFDGHPGAEPGNGCQLQSDGRTPDSVFAHADQYGAAAQDGVRDGKQAVPDRMASDLSEPAIGKHSARVFEIVWRSLPDRG